jgi:alpha,alpha-trehalase
MKRKLIQIKKRLIQTPMTQIDSVIPKRHLSIDEQMQELFHDVQFQRLHADAKMFADAIPLKNRRKILAAYELSRQRPGFDLKKFIAQHFSLFQFQGGEAYEAGKKITVEQHIERLWDVLKREAYRDKGSLISLPYPYIVPGGRYDEQFYWDVYFTMLGLAESGHFELIEGMLKNYANMLRRFGCIPTANRTYFISRSQPPVFSYMVELLAAHKGKATLVRYLPYLIREYKFWMTGRKNLTEDESVYRRVVRLPDGAVLNRYFDQKSTPRPDIYNEDIDITREAKTRRPSEVYLDIRAAAESGWDFSSRWLRDGKHMHTIHTTDIIPVDLNCLLVHLEQTIAQAYRILKQGMLASQYEKKAQKRIDAINTYCWNEKEGFYFDYDFVAKKQTPIYSMAASFALFTNVASQAQADVVAAMLEKKFLQKGGLVTTLTDSDQQWDWPNGWAPMQWVGIEGLRQYGHTRLAQEVRVRWIATNMAVFNKYHKLVEKYDVIHPGQFGKTGDYPLQDGFGWTNGVLLKLLNEDKL